MKIYLMRHGEASFDAPNDDLRELTENGRNKIRFNIEKKHAELSVVGCFFSSPICRARQTADLACRVLKRDDRIIEVDWLVHGSTPARAIAALAELDADSVMLFTHQPFASRLVEILCGLEQGAMTLNTAAVVAMEAEPVASGCGDIIWQLS